MVSIAAGLYHSLALKSDSTVYAWGYNYYAQLGSGVWDFSNSELPNRVSNLTGVVAVAAGMYHSLALKADGTVWSWGDDDYGQSGNGTTTWRVVPVQVSSLTDGIAVSGGGHYSLALKSDGTVWTWGNNRYGQLGDGNNSYRSTLTQTLDLLAQASNFTDMVAVEGGSSHSLAISSDGSVWAWGDNTNGQLGFGPTISSNTPFKVPGLTGVIAVAAGSSHSLALKNDGTVWAWGYNGYGQVGDGTNINSNIPIQVNLADVVAISAGYFHRVAVKSEATVWAWGFNY